MSVLPTINGKELSSQESVTLQMSLEREIQFQASRLGYNAGMLEDAIQAGDTKRTQQYTISCAQYRAIIKQIRRMHILLNGLDSSLETRFQQGYKEGQETSQLIVKWSNNG